MQVVNITMRCRAFNNTLGQNKLQVEINGPGTGTVHAWDSVSNTYTLCHSLPRRTVIAARRKACQQAKLPYVKEWLYQY